jgi:very-short-patch-repair endonuclease
VVENPEQFPQNDLHPRVDVELARRASGQHGVLSRAQLLDAGIDDERIRYRLKIGRLHRLHRGVYAVGFVSSSPLTRAMAAVLACGPDAVLSHRSAAALWEFGARWRGPVEVTTGSKRQRHGVIAHRSQTLAPGDLTVHQAIPVTTVARTVVDLAHVLGERALERAVNDARLAGRLRVEDLALLLDRLPIRKGTARLAALLAHDDAPTRSAFEDEFLRFARRHDLPRPQVNQRIAGYEVDMVWRPQRLIAELDGRRFHAHPRAFEADRKRDAYLVAAGYRVVRVTWRRLVGEPEREAGLFRELLGQGRPSTG